MATWAQDVILCELCNTSAKQFCNNCQVNLCVNCINKHVGNLHNLSHDIVPVTNRRIQLVFPDCKFHPGQRCEVQCLQCQTPICIKCCIASHKNHNAEELSKLVDKMKQKIQNDTEEIETKLIPKYNKTDASLRSKLSNSTAELTKLKEEKEKLRKLWHTEVDTVFDTLEILIHVMEECYLNTIEDHLTKIKTLTQDMLQTALQNKQLLNNKTAANITDYESKLNEYKDLLNDCDVSFPSLISNTVSGNQLSITMGPMTATLTNTLDTIQAFDVSFFSTKQLKNKASVIAVIPTKIEPVLKVCCVGEYEALIAGENNFPMYVGIRGSIKDWFLNREIRLVDFAVTNQGKHICIGYNFIRVDETGKPEKFIQLKQNWTPCSVACTRSEDILIHMVSKFRKESKIFRYRGEEISQILDDNENGKQLFGGTKMCFTENNNGDICLSRGSKVVVINKEGRFRFQYGGKAARQPKTFSPCCLITDPLSQIIVTDINNSCLHILDGNGYFLRFLDNCGLHKPFGLSIDMKGRLWVGVIGKLTGEIKVIQYLKED